MKLKCIKIKHESWRKLSHLRKREFIQGIITTKHHVKQFLLVQKMFENILLKFQGSVTDSSSDISNSNAHLKERVNIS